MKKRKLLITVGLPYANGDLHLGHLVGYLQADIWTRFQKLRGHDCQYFCGSDTHGTPILVNAQKNNMTPEDFVAHFSKRQLEDFKAFNIEFTEFGSSHSETNKKLVYEFYKAMEDKDLVYKKSIQQAFCEHDDMFLPGRFVKGTCPSCGAENQYGDYCDVCSATYDSLAMKNAQCIVCGNSPTKKDSEHIFFKLSEFQEFLIKWVGEHTQEEVANKMINEWLKGELRDWDISRDKPYFGFLIPGSQDKYFYVWVDAPITYMSAAKDWCSKQKVDFNQYWNDKEREIYHIIGKDIIYFHSLYWPAMLSAADYQLPKKIMTHGMLKVNGEKMSKSKGTFINARTYLEHLEPELLRFYFASKMSSSSTDIDLSFPDFVQRVNSELVGKITNLFSRGAQMLNKKIDGVIGELDDEGRELLNKAYAQSEVIADYFEAREFNKAMQEIRSVAEEGNRYFDEKTPWKTIKEDEEAARAVLSATLNLCRVIALYIKPVMPLFTKQVETLLNIPELRWGQLKDTLQNHKISEFKPLVQRIDNSQVEVMIEQQKAIKA